LKIAAALSRKDEADSLLAAGAEELFCGVVTEELAPERTTSRFNRRYEREASLRSLADLADVAARAAARKAPVFVTLNEHAYDPALIPALTGFARELKAAGAKAVIVSDVSLMLAIRRARVPIDIHVSSVATCTNSESAAFFADLGARRIILPRHLSVRQISRLIAAGPRMEYEAFVMNDGCGFEEGLCMNTHQDSGPMCQMDWDTKPVPAADPRPGLAAEWKINWKAYRRLMSSLDNQGGKVSPQGVPAGPCGLCALPSLKAAGVASVKVAGRLGSPALRLGGVRITRAVLDRMEHGGSFRSVAAYARRLRGMPRLCAGTYTCYYR
jgi:hypothetical protein